MTARKGTMLTQLTWNDSRRIDVRERKTWPVEMVIRIQRLMSSGFTCRSEQDFAIHNTKFTDWCGARRELQLLRMRWRVEIILFMRRISSKETPKKRFSLLLAWCLKIDLCLPFFTSALHTHHPCILPTRPYIGVVFSPEIQPGASSHHPSPPPDPESFSPRNNTPLYCTLSIVRTVFVVNICAEHLA